MMSFMRTAADSTRIVTCEDSQPRAPHTPRAAHARRPAPAPCASSPASSPACRPAAACAQCCASLRSSSRGGCASGWEWRGTDCEGFAAFLSTSALRIRCVSCSMETTKNRRAQPQRRPDSRRVRPSDPVDAAERERPILQYSLRTGFDALCFTGLTLAKTPNSSPCLCSMPCRPVSSQPAEVCQKSSSLTQSATPRRQNQVTV